MEPRFENKYVGKHKMLAEFARKYMIGPRMPVVVVGWVLYAFLLASYLLGAANYEDLPFFIFMGVILLVMAFMPQWYTWLIHRSTKKQNDGILPETVISFGDTIEMHEGMVHITVEYRKIVRVVQLKHSYVLMLGKRNGVMLDPNGFTKGTFKEFKQFLHQVRPDLMLPDAKFPWVDDCFTASEEKSPKG